jgi:hypothetical protein
MPTSPGLEDLLTVRSGPLKDTVLTFDPSTIQQAREIVSRLRNTDRIPADAVWTGDFAIYTIEADAPILYLAPTQYNMILRRPSKATRDLLSDGNYRPTRNEVREITQAATNGLLARVNLSKLALKPGLRDSSYLEFETGRVDNLTPDERAIAETVYGRGEDFLETMHFLHSANLTTTRIYTLSPDYLQATLQGRLAIGRACWINLNHNIPWFIAMERLVYEPYAMVGVAK